MKVFKITMNADSKKEFFIEANNREEAVDLLDKIYLQTELITFDESDVVLVTTDIKEVKYDTTTEENEELLEDIFQQEDEEEFEENEEADEWNNQINKVEICCPKCKNCTDITNIIEDYVS